MFGLLKNKISGFVDDLVGRKKKQEDDAKDVQVEIEKKDGEEGIEKKKDIVEEKKEIEITDFDKKEIEQAEQPKLVKASEEALANKVEVFDTKKTVKPLEKKFLVKKHVEEVATEQKPQVVEQKIEAVESEPRHLEMPQGREREVRLPLESSDTLEEIYEQKEIEEKRTAPVEKKIEPKKSVFDMAAGLFAKKPEEKAAFEKVDISKKKKLEKKDIEIGTPVGVDGTQKIERLEKTALENKKEMKVKVGVTKTLGNIFSSKVTVEKKDVDDLLDGLELSLLEADVGLDVSEEVKKRLETKLVGLQVDKTQMQQQVNNAIKEVLVQIMTPPATFDFSQKIAGAQRPVKILFVGPNGAGKTTTIAKFAKMFRGEGLEVCFAAADTFRAAAIEQLSEHAQKLEVPIIKSKYGADPASVAFDAIKYAKIHKIDVVLIDSAGRQDTNANLIDEMKKIERVISPDLKLYVGESIGGNALIEQIRAFHEAIGINGAVLTKLDCDAKGGTAISLSYSTGVPILFLGTGQKYEDLQKFDAEFLATQILN